ncbi:phosphatidylinositide phosphatase SAC2 isoform X2 [Homalodisca vitripennis]|nr:phosphatidylinositide phosphatase SAC2 isoform X2 [Homalodisca vitripennis]
MSEYKTNLPEMEVFRTENYYVFLNSTSSLWCNRKTGEFQVKPGWELANSGDPECLGVFYGLIGQLELLSDCRLLLVKDAARVGELQGRGTVYKIRSIALLQPKGPDVTAGELKLKPCRKHCNSNTSIATDNIQKVAFAKTWGTIKSAGSTIKNTTQQAAALATSQVKGNNQLKDKEKYERRVVEELHRVFTDTDSFYFCVDGAGQPADLTNTLQRHCELTPATPRWRNVDKRFFWNKYMLKEILLLNDPLAEAWVLPVVQGFFQIEQCHVEVGFDVRVDNNSVTPRYEVFTLSLLSRRSRYRAGTRYKRRGLDDSGHCANYVETEQIISHRHHQVAVTLVRGSVPVYWSQPGYKYRPPPRLDKGEAETKIAFERHFEEELLRYGPVCVVNLIEQTGKERVIWDAFTSHVLQYNHPDITYVTFDFHEYCRGMRFENVSALVTSLSDVIHEQGFTWKDKQGLICRQTGVFRVNCIDCLDRTNVVQTALAKAVLELQLTKLGLIPPEGCLPPTLRASFQLLWANNGDTISKQYAGTNALKGDYTRTGERKLSGMMKDGMNSANRYYLSRFKDAYRQATIDMMLGNPLPEDVFMQGEVEEDNSASVEHVKSLIEDCKKLLLSDSSLVLGAWGLIDADPVTGDPSETEMDTILILTRDSYYVAEYDDQIDRVTKYQQVPLPDLTLIELGVMDSSFSVSHSPMQLFKNKNNKGHYCLRLNYSVGGQAGYCHTFRSTNLRFFNNVAVMIKTEEEMIESLRAIAETVQVGLEVAGLAKPQVKLCDRLQRKNTLQPSWTRHNDCLQIPGNTSLTRNVSETQLTSLKTAGSKALTNMSQQFSKLNRLGQSFNMRRKHGDRDTADCKVDGTAKFVLGAEEGKECSEDDDDDVVVGRINEKLSRQTSVEAFIPNVGIVMSNADIKVVGIDEEKAEQFTPCITDVTLNQIVQSDVNLKKYQSPQCLEDVSKTNEENSKTASGIGIVVEKEKVKVEPPKNLPLEKNDQHRLSSNEGLDKSKKFSRSSGDVDTNVKDRRTESGLTVDGDRRNSERDLSLGISSSQSENAIKSIRATANTVLTSPSAVLSPFSKLAKGVQNFGANLDPRKVVEKVGTKQVVSLEHIATENAELEEKWKHSKCKSRLIAV